MTGHPEREAHELVFLSDLTVELRAWPCGTWATLGVDPQVIADAVITAWRGGHIEGLQLGALTTEEALALERPAMTYVREQLRQQLGRQVGRAYRRWLDPTSGRRPGDRFLQQRTPADFGSVRGGHQPSGQRTLAGCGSVRGGQRRPDTGPGCVSIVDIRRLRQCAQGTPPVRTPSRLGASSDKHSGGCAAVRSAAHGRSRDAADACDYRRVPRTLRKRFRPGKT